MTSCFLVSMCREEKNNKKKRKLFIRCRKRIKKLIDLDYIRKETNTKDSRAYCLYLTDKAKAIIPAMKEELGIWNEIMTQNLTEEEKDNITDLLSKVLGNIKKYRLENEESD